MLMHLSVRNYAIVEHLELDLAPGMSAITGQTGAGKSILLDALGLALGDRADSGSVRPDTDKAEILACFELAQMPAAQAWLKERDLDNDQQCILRRVITAEGRSRGYINGSQSPLADLRALGSLLIDIHNQHEHHSLLNPQNHVRLLDEFAGATDLARQVQLAAQRWKQTRSALLQAKNQANEQRARQQLLGYQLEELESLGLEDGELERLEAQHKALCNAESLLTTGSQVTDLCRDNEAGNLLSVLSACLNRLTAHPEPPQAFTVAAELLTSAQIQVEEAVGELNHFIDTFDADPERQQQIEERLDAIYRLARKHRIMPQQLTALHAQLLDELANLNDADQSVERLSQELAAYQRHYQELAGELSRLRQVAAQKLASEVQTQIQRLGMPKGRFSVQLAQDEPNEPSARGLEQVEFLVSANPGQPLRPLAKVASGGELSRISLAIQVATAQTSTAPTLVFDEVDVGIGGATAEIVGRLLRQLGQRGQVLTVTHQPQVAAQGHHHLHVYKADDSQHTRSAISCLQYQQRVEELARMLGGVELTDESLRHARQMLDSAQQPQVAARKPARARTQAAGSK